jgi:hypothetical protein
MARAAAALVLGAAFWSLMMATSAAFSLWRLDWRNEDAVGRVVVLFALGAFLAYPPAIAAARLLTRSRPPETRFAAFAVGLAAGTIGVTALLFGLFYRLYYAHWHGEPFSVVWVYQYGFTVAAAIYHFLVLGLWLYLPVGLAALLVFSVWQARRRR